MNPAGANDKAEQLVPDAVEAIDDGMAIIDRDHHIIWVNKRLEGHYASIEPLLDNRCFKLMASSDTPCDGCPLSFAADDERSGAKDVPRSLSFGGAVSFEIRCSPLRDSTGHVMGVIAHLLDAASLIPAEDALRAEVARRRALFEQSRDGIVVLTRDGQVYEANEQYARMLGYTLDEAYQLSIWDWNKDNTPEQLVHTLRSDDSRGHVIETRHTRKDGSIFDVEITSNAVALGEETYILCLCRDVDEQHKVERERKAAQDALADEVSRRRLLVEQSRDGIVVLDEEGCVWESNAAFDHMLGYTPEEMLSLRVWDWEYQYSPDQVLGMLATVDDAGDHFVTKHRRKDGSTYEVEISTNGLTYGDKKLIFCVCRDISEQMRTEREIEAAKDALEEEVLRRRLLVDQSRDGIVVLTADGKVYEANQQYARQLGYTLDEVYQLFIWDWDKDYPPEALLGMLRAVDSSGYSLATRHRRKDGSFIDVEISTNAAVFGEQKYIQCICRDMSEQRQAQREREALVYELQEALAELKTLRGIIPVCSFCKKVRDDRGYWEQVEVYIRKNSEAAVSHGICPDCLNEHFPGMKARPVSSAKGRGAPGDRGE